MIKEIILFIMVVSATLAFPSLSQDTPLTLQATLTGDSSPDKAPIDLESLNSDLEPSPSAWGRYKRNWGGYGRGYGGYGRGWGGYGGRGGYGGWGRGGYGGWGHGYGHGGGYWG